MDIPPGVVGMTTFGISSRNESELEEALVVLEDSVLLSGELRAWKK